ncbi:hypothetical protein GGX14DRAFT_391288 [Mycena pura]|uniref:Uncharacterized protein n=1 Tax=Mycena pura TaxID=153505 RepID=A0AAD6VQF0_9AGAR|nr:hypothetical protein GGX14DRAFT_391288 [Mycena pura]
MGGKSKGSRERRRKWVYIPKGILQRTHKGKESPTDLTQATITEANTYQVTRHVAKGRWSRGYGETMCERYALLRKKIKEICKGTRSTGDSSLRKGDQSSSSQYIMASTDKNQCNPASQDNVDADGQEIKPNQPPPGFDCSKKLVVELAATAHKYSTVEQYEFIDFFERHTDGPSDANQSQALPAADSEEREDGKPAWTVELPEDLD